MCGVVAGGWRRLLGTVAVGCTPCFEWSFLVCVCVWGRLWRLEAFTRESLAGTVVVGCTTCFEGPFLVCVRVGSSVEVGGGY